MRTYDENIEMDKTLKSGCFGPRRKNILSASLLCRKLGIEHYIIPLQEEFRHKVIDYFCETYIKGKTPNPCLVCNAYIKFAVTW